MLYFKLLVFFDKFFFLILETVDSFFQLCLSCAPELLRIILKLAEPCLELMGLNLSLVLDCMGVPWTFFNVVTLPLCVTNDCIRSDDPPEG